MTHDGSMRFLERAEAFSLFFFFSAESASARQRRGSSCRMACWLVANFMIGLELCCQLGKL